MFEVAMIASPGGTFSESSIARDRPHPGDVRRRELGGERRLVVAGRARGSARVEALVNSMVRLSGRVGGSRPGRKVMSLQRVAAVRGAGQQPHPLERHHRRTRARRSAHRRSHRPHPAHRRAWPSRQPGPHHDPARTGQLALGAVIRPAPRHAQRPRTGARVTAPAAAGRTAHDTSADNPTRTVPSKRAAPITQSRAHAPDTRHRAARLAQQAAVEGEPVDRGLGVRATRHAK